MSSFLEQGRSTLARIGRNFAEGMIRGRTFVSQPQVTGRSKRYVQPLRLIPGMSAAPEPCLLPQHWSADQHPPHAVAQPKVDGIRALYIDTTIISREALPLDCALHCLPALHELELLYGRAMVFDGEYREPGGFSDTLAAWRAGVGVGTIWLFDAVPYDEWRKNRFTETLEDRVRKLCTLQERIGSPFIRSLGLTRVETPEQAELFAQGEWSRGGEGIVVKNGRDTYQRGKSRSWLKLKKEQSFDGVIVDTLIKDGRCRGIMVKMPDDSPLPGKVVRISSNLPDELREAMLRASDQFVGAVAEICFNDTDDCGNLRGGYFVRMRPDKGDI